MSEVKAAVVQDAPIPLAITDGIAQAARLAAQAIEGGARIVGFGETFLGGYPLWLDEAPGAALWDHPGTRQLHAILLREGVHGDDPRLAALQDLADKSGALISIGAHERVRSSLTNTQFLFRPAAPPIRHRKLVPTHGERLIWGRGDGSSLVCHQADWGLAGQLICWEHWMPFARAALHHAGEAVHVSAWPTVREMYLIASRHYAFEGRTFVLAAGTVQHRADLLDGLARTDGDGPARDLILGIPDDRLQHGGSAIVAPDGALLAQAGAEPEILTATLDLGEIGRNLASLDTDGHYSRPDVFELRVDRRPKPGLVDAD